MQGYGITIIPSSWALGLWRKKHKSLIAVGPIRFVHYKSIKGAYGE